MKKSILFAFFFATTLLASANPPGEVTQKHATELTRKYAEPLGLNEGRFLQMRRLVYNHLLQAAEINVQYEEDAALREEKLKSLQTEFNEQLKGILTEAQYARYTSLSVNLLAAQLPTTNTKP